MPRYRIHRMKEGPQESFRWAAHTGGLAVVKPKDYQSLEEIESDNPYHAWKLMAGKEAVLRAGDLLEIVGAGGGSQNASTAMWIAKYIGFEPAQWWVGDVRAELAAADENREPSPGLKVCL